MPFRAVLLDWGGTIVSQRPVDPGEAAAAVCRALACHGLTIAPPEFREAFAAQVPPSRSGEAAFAGSLAPILARALRSPGREASEAALEAALGVLADVEAGGQRVFDDARALLASLRYRGFQTAVVTNTLFPARLFARRLAALGLAGYVDAVACSADLGLAKPDPAPYRAALNALGSPAEEALFVGDRVDIDIAGAHAARVAAVRIDRTRASPDFTARVVHRLTALQHWLGEGPAPR